MSALAEWDNEATVLVLRPVFRDSGPDDTPAVRREHLVGLLGISVSVGQMMERALKPMSNGLDVRLFDVSGCGKPAVSLYV